MRLGALIAAPPSMSDVCVNDCGFSPGRGTLCIHFYWVCVCVHEDICIALAIRKVSFIASVKLMLTSRCSHSWPANCKQTHLCLSEFTQTPSACVLFSQIYLSIYLFCGFPQTQSFSPLLCIMKDKSVKLLLASSVRFGLVVSTRRLKMVRPLSPRNSSCLSWGTPFCPQANYDIWDGLV